MGRINSYQIKGYLVDGINMVNYVNLGNMKLLDRYLVGEMMKLIWLSI